MAIRLNRTEEERKVGTRVLNSEEHQQMRNWLNEKVKKLRRDYLIKSIKSEQSASKVFFTC